MVVLSVIISAILGELYTERGSMLSTAIFVYAATSPINGYAGGGLYARMGGRIWIKQMILSAFMLPIIVCGTAFFINFIAMYYHASRAIPFGSMVSIYYFRAMHLFECNISLGDAESEIYLFTGGSNLYLHICYTAVNISWNHLGSQFSWNTGRTV